LTLIIVPVMFYLVNRAKVRYADNKKTKADRKAEARLNLESEK